MDEPTTSPDARATTIIMRTVRNTVDIGRTVVCTIHQPSYIKLLLSQMTRSSSFYHPK